MRLTSLVLQKCPVTLIALGAITAAAQDISPGAVWVYQLTEGSQIVDECPICDRIPIVEPIRGSFELRLIQQDPLYSYYALTNLCFTNVGNSNWKYKVTGDGVLQIGGEVALRQNLFLRTRIFNGVTNDLCFLETNSAAVTRFWPMLQVGADQTNGTLTQQYHLELNAAPLREIWFSTADDFTAAIWEPPTNLVSRGNLLSTAGRTVRSNTDLTRRFGVMPPTPDLGLKDLDVLAGGEIALSIEQDVWSETLGRTLHSGDLLSERGLVLRINQSLTAAFNPDPAAAGGVGLAAVKVLGSGETWFSVQTNFFSRALNSTITTGDLLSDSGVIIRTNAELLSRFKPDPTTNVALKAVYVWPSGEIWFCLGTGFSGGNSTQYEAGDLLSDQGYRVYRNSELLTAFAPKPGTTNAVDALWVVTDAIPNSAPPVLLPPFILNEPPGTLVLDWRGEGKVFQLEKATNPAGPYIPAGPISPGRAMVEVGALTNSPAAFYRVHQW